jgi:hypothetical protein
VVTLSSSDTEETLELLSLSPSHGPPSRPSDPCSSSGNDLFKDWPEANDMAISVYVALTADALSSRASTATAHLMDESLVLVAHLRDRLAHRRLRCDGPISENSKTWELRTGGLKGLRKPPLNVPLQRPRLVVVSFPLSISINQNGKLCTPVSSRKASLTLVIELTRKMYSTLFL